MNHKLILSLFTAALLATGCASTSEPLSYNNDKSRALNIAQAGGVYDASDRIVHRANYEGLQFAGNTMNKTLLFTSSAGAGLDLVDGFGTGLALSLAENPTPANRNSIIAWMPESDAASKPEAAEKLREAFTKAIELSLDELGANYVKSPGHKGEVVEIRFDSETLGCPDYTENPELDWRELCFVQAQIIEPKTPSLTPAFVSSEATSYRFNSKDKYRYNRFKVLLPEQAQALQEPLTRAISRNLPDWAFIYIARGQVQLDEQTVTVPYLLEQGTPHLFIHHDDA
ncbi:hypothetical protein LA020_003598 [Vibrio alginolyticus]|uniref:hypothetical protein n=1 Tax=Vibrio cholerae TaxID=666 RepID=UPI0011D86717|nr:hypothetical protein [Vibrio cholerae]EIC9815894.1 hypothetical protein [Vibrio alginolyticus]TXZ98633.1 hypothetical protein FXE22_04895 [Vibrio cholerae]